MFCANCGTSLQPGQNFCRSCGHPANRPADAAPPPPPAHAAAGGRCDWCGAAIDSSQPACPRCGAVLKQPAPSAASGWAQLPGRKDMTRLQIGNSSCQIEGLYVPVADINLAAGDSVYFTHHVLL